MKSYWEEYDKYSVYSEIYGTLKSSTESISGSFSQPITVSPAVVPNISIDLPTYGYDDLPRYEWCELAEVGERRIPRKYNVDRIVKSGPVTIVFWEDGTKTIVRRSDDTEDNPYNAFCAALAKKMYGTNSSLQRMIAKKTVEQKKKEKK